MKRFCIELETDEIQENNVPKRIISKTKLYLDIWLQKDVEKAIRSHSDIFDNTIFIFRRSMIEELIANLIKYRQEKKLRDKILSYKKKLNVEREERNHIFKTSHLADQSALSKHKHKYWTD